MPLTSSSAKVPDLASAPVNEPWRLSVAIPVYNEELVLPELLRRVLAVLDTLPGGPHELVLVDDGSRDNTRAIIQAQAERDPRIVLVALSRNFGHQAAFSAALDFATGDAVVCMDGDLQDVPEAIPELVARHREGYDIVYARRVRRKEGIALRLSYFVFYRLLGRLSNVALPADAGDFSLLSRRALDEVRRLPERHRYVRGLRTWVGFRQIGIDIERAARAAGTSKYSLLKLLKLAADGIFSFSIAPLRAATIVGAVAIALSLVYALYALWAKLVLDRSPQGFTTLILVLTFFSGVQLLFLGVIGEYVGRIYEESKGRPHYVVDAVTRAGIASEVTPHWAHAGVGALDFPRDH
jgi:glycosyltransferase involved in cell wall biosynthesis